jgi:tRNA U38,U39,U40 pseudouridine synthase TruA
VHLKISTSFRDGSVVAPPLEAPAWLEAVQAELDRLSPGLPEAGISSTVRVCQRFSCQADADVRCLCQKREYRYHVPYSALLLPVELAQAARPR